MTIAQELDLELAKGREEWEANEIAVNWDVAMAASLRLIRECGFHSRAEVRRLANKYGRRVA